MAIVSGSGTLRASAVLTLGYVISTNVLETLGAPAVNLEFNFTVGASSGFTFYVEESDDNSTWFETAIYAAATKQADLYEVTVTGTSLREYRVSTTKKFMRVRAKGLVDITGTLLTITATAVRT